MRVGRKAAGRTRCAVLGPCPSEDGGGPGSLPASPERTACRPHVEGARRGRENETGFQRVRIRARQDAAPISVRPTSGIRQRSPSREPGGGRRIRDDGDPPSKPSRPRPRRERSSMAVPGQPPRRVSLARRDRFRTGGPLKVGSKEVRARTISRNRDAAAVSMRSIDGRSLDLDDVIAVAREGELVRLAPAAAKRVDASRRALEKVVAKGTLAYGIKTGFGELANVAISDADVRALQLNLLRSHAIGQGLP